MNEIINSTFKAEWVIRKRYSSNQTSASFLSRTGHILHNELCNRNELSFLNPIHKRTSCFIRTPCLILFAKNSEGLRSVFYSIWSQLL